MTGTLLKRIATALATVGTLTAHAHDCDFDVRAAEAVFEAKAKTDSKVRGFKRDQKNNRVEDSAVLKDGTRVTLTHGGCAHLTTGYRFESVHLTRLLKKPRELLVLLIGHIGALPFKAKFKDEGRWVSAELEGWENTPSHFEPGKGYAFPCEKPDFQCRLTVESATVVTVTKTF